jgi:hypothetical protein
MTDDDRIAALFSEAASDTPPPRFDHDRVVATSRRITARRRSAVLGGAMALLLVTGVGVAVGLPSTGRDAASTAAGAPAPEAAADSAAGARAESAPLAGPGSGPGVAPDAAPAPALPEFTGTPLGPGTTECAQRQDPQLREYLEEVLPEVVGASEAAVTMDCRPGGERGVGLEVDDAGATGLLTVQYLPPGVATTGADPVAAPTASGGTVVVGSRGDGPGAPAPFATRLADIAAYLAPRL